MAETNEGKVATLIGATRWKTDQGQRKEKVVDGCLIFINGRRSFSGSQSRGAIAGWCSLQAYGGPTKGLISDR